MANIYIDESGSINNHSKYAKDFVIALVVAKNPNALRRAYKRFVSKNLEELRELDSAASLKGKSRMFQNNRFKELKGSCFDREMKVRFVDFITRKNYFDLFLIKVDNTLLTDEFCKNTARAFNFIVKIALESFIKMGLLANEDHLLNLDERNERTDTKFFLQEYLNTELVAIANAQGNFVVQYFDSSNNIIVQIADVFANLYYSNLRNSKYSDIFLALRQKGILKYVFKFPK